MDNEDEEIFIKQCYKCEQSILGNLNVFYNSSNSKIVLWNKYQIFVYEDIEFQSLEKVLVPEFQIHYVIASNNHLLCLDCNGNVHITSLKFKNTTKRLKTAFQPREKGIKTCIRYKEDHILSLKYDADTYFLCLHKMNSDFQIEKKVILLYNTEHWPLGQDSKEKYLLTSCTVNKDKFEHLKNIFKTEENTRNVQDLIVLSFDKLTIYGCLFTPKLIEDEITLVKLYDCPAEICNLEIIDSGELYLLIGLTIGTIMRVFLNDLSKNPDIVHLNTALYKMVVLKDSILYSDGATMWKSENTFSNDFKLTQLFVTNTNDFAKCGDQIVCTTFNKLIYKFSFGDKNTYLIPKTTEEYCSAEKLLNNFEYLNALFEEIEKNNELVQKLSREQDYITALSLSNRQDLVTRAIKSSVLVLESYNEANGMEFTLTEDMKEYFEEDSWLFLVKIVNTNIFNTLNDILSHLTDNIRIHITLLSLHSILKTTSIKMEEPLKTVNFLIPCSLKNIQTEIKVNMKILLNIPGAYDKKHQTMSVLYREDIVLTSEHFINTSNNTSASSLRKPKEPIKDLIQKTSSIKHGRIFKFTDISKLKGSETEWSFYVKLPNDYEDIFKTDKHCKKYLSCSKSTFLTQQWNTEEFLKSKTHVILTIGNERLKVQIENDGFSNSLLKVTGSNAKMAFDLRNFFSLMMYQEYENQEPGIEFISSTFYTTAENLQKAVKNCIKSSASLEVFLPIMDQFEKNVIGVLPL